MKKRTTPSRKTFERLTQKLIRELENHPHREEVVTLALGQLLDCDSDSHSYEASQLQHGW